MDLSEEDLDAIVAEGFGVPYAGVPLEAAFRFERAVLLENHGPHHPKHQIRIRLQLQGLVVAEGLIEFFKSESP